MCGIILMGCATLALGGYNLGSLTPVNATFEEQRILIPQCAREIGVPSDSAFVVEETNVAGGADLTVQAGLNVSQDMANKVNACKNDKLLSLATGKIESIDAAAQFTSVGYRRPNSVMVQQPSGQFCPVGRAVMFADSSYCLKN